MAGPITWRGVQSASAAEALRPLLAAQQSFAGGFDALGNVLNQTEKVQANNVNVQNEVAKQNYLDMVAGAKTPEQLAALQATDEFKSAFAGLNAANRNAVRGADEARMQSVQGQLVANQKFGEGQTTFAQKAVRDQAQALIAQGKTAEADTLIRSAGLVDTAPLYQAAKVADRTAITEGQADTRFGWSAARQPLEMAALKTTNALNSNNLTTSNITTANTVEADEADRLADQMVTPRLQALTNTNASINANIKKLGEAGKFPLDASGMPDVDKMTTEQAAQFKGQLKQAGLDRAPSTSAALEEIKRQAIADGAKPKVIDAITKRADAALKNASVLSTEDQTAIAAEATKAEAWEADAAKNNLFYTPPKQLNQAKIDVLGTVDGLIKDGPSTKTRLREKMNKWMDDGIEITKDGKTVKVQVPPKVVQAALSAGLESDTWFKNDTDNNMESAIKTILTSPAYDTQRQEADWINADGHLRAKRNLQQSLKEKAGTVSPSDYLTNFDKTLNAKLLADQNKSTKLKKFN